MSKPRGPYRVDPLGYKKSQQALDKMAENARELGLHYEPAQQELVACQYAKDVAMPEYRCVGRCQYDTFPQRTWVGLTDDELADFWFKQSLDWMEFARVIEDALRSKNT